MKKRCLIIFALIALIAAGCSQYKAQPLPAPATGDKEAMQTETNTVAIEGFAFNPQEVKIKAGESMTWANLDSAPHTVKFDTFESERIGRGGKYEHAFMEAGEYAYVCGIHPSMKGRVVVQ